MMQTVHAQTKVIAHRGFWKTDGSAQNSIASLLKADSIGCYGSEFDVWLSADGELVVNHDASLHGKKMEKSTAAELNTLKLKNGEQMPTLQQYFDAAKKTDIKLILELKKLKSAQFLLLFILFFFPFFFLALLLFLCSEKQIKT